MHGSRKESQLSTIINARLCQWILLKLSAKSLSLTSWKCSTFSYNIQAKRAGKPPRIALYQKLRYPWGENESGKVASGKLGSCYLFVCLPLYIYSYWFLSSPVKLAYPSNLAHSRWSGVLYEGVSMTKLNNLKVKRVKWNLKSMRSQS